MDWMWSLPRGLSGRHRPVLLENYVLWCRESTINLASFASTLTRLDIFDISGNSRRVMQCMILCLRSFLGIPSFHPISFVYMPFSF
ncbi:hypothetical protein BDV27DRAFT_97385 [Aspergillus caelatus]|uniref:Uncharacterized protein n=2 Tax=Aspergillus subgen. Circumdati TaxID=2720871 RepID=A0A5N7AMV8_9EURO|nr:uncharacterized protein BDV27DRAFT_97385 [Aspergillus caelatus]KAE8370050.1 hypothetical protein BDV27DRAFT_97385 [Aspergillus caelatus]KAE8422090.1 hypothetical protein BDV36DRAFT_5805 [Aspergillus pseudocaelatus]